MGFFDQPQFLREARANPECYHRNGAFLCDTQPCIVEGVDLCSPFNGWIREMDDEAAATAASTTKTVASATTTAAATTTVAAATTTTTTTTTAAAAAAAATTTLAAATTTATITALATTAATTATVTSTTVTSTIKASTTIASITEKIKPIDIPSSAYISLFIGLVLLAIVILVTVAALNVLQRRRRQRRSLYSADSVKTTTQDELRSSPIKLEEVGETQILIQPSYKPPTPKLKSYQRGKVLGQGSFGVVYNYSLKNTRNAELPKDLAVKICLKLGFEVTRERHFAEKLSHSNIVKFFGCEEDGINVFIVMELAKMNLVQFAKEWKVFTNEDVTNIGKQLVIGLTYLHSKDIVHRDIKPHNILLSWRNCFNPHKSRSLKGVIVKMCDFGFGRYVSDQLSKSFSVKCTERYMAPEVRNAIEKGLPSWRGNVKAADVFSLGLVLAELRYHLELHNASSNQETILEHAQQIPIEGLETNGNSLKSIIVQMTLISPGLRPSARQMLIDIQKIRQDVQILSPYGRRTAFHDACFKGDVNTATLLLERAADVEERDVQGFTPLYIACEMKHAQLVSLLLENGAEADNGITNGSTPLYSACLGNNIEIVTKLLEHGADVNKAKSNGETPLYTACQNGYHETAKLLLKYDANANIVTKGETPLYTSCQRNNLEVVHLLLSNGADVNKAHTERNESPLYVACVMGHIEIVKMLLESGADINIADINGLTPRDISIKNGHPKVVEMLFQQSEFES